MEIDVSDLLEQAIAAKEDAERRLERAMEALKEQYDARCSRWCSSKYDRIVHTVECEEGRQLLAALRPATPPPTCQHDWKTDCSYGPAFCGRCGVAKPDAPKEED